MHWTKTLPKKKQSSTIILLHWHSFPFDRGTFLPFFFSFTIPKNIFPLFPPSGPLQFLWAKAAKSFLFAILTFVRKDTLRAIFPGRLASNNHRWTLRDDTKLQISWKIPLEDLKGPSFSKAIMRLSEVTVVFSIAPGLHAIRYKALVTKLFDRPYSGADELAAFFLLLYNDVLDPSFLRI